MRSSRESVHRPSAKVVARRGSRCVAVVGVSTVLVVSGCRGEASQPTPSSEASISSAPSSTRHPSTTSTTTAAPPPTAPFVTSNVAAPGPNEEEIIRRYLGYWDARYQAGREPVNPDYPLLREYATGRQLETLLTETRYRQQHGEAFRYPEPSISRRDVQVTSIEGEKASVYDCLVDDGIIYRIGTGEIINGEVGTQSVTADLVLVEGKWKVEAAHLIQNWAGVAGCALAGD